MACCNGHFHVDETGKKETIQLMSVSTRPASSDDTSLIAKSVVLYVNRPVGQSVSQQTNRPVGRLSVSRSLGQLVSQSVSHSFRQ